MEYSVVRRGYSGVHPSTAEHTWYSRIQYSQAQYGAARHNETTGVQQDKAKHSGWTEIKYEREGEREKKIRTRRSLAGHIGTQRDRAVPNDAHWDANIHTTARAPSFRT